MALIDVIVAVNQMQADGIIDRYAIGGAVGATFYLAPISTADVDIFIELHADGDSLLVSLDPILDYLKAQGFSMLREHVEIGSWPVQFLPPTGPLIEDAIANAVTVTFDGLTATVFTAEHLAAIALQTGRAKDKARLVQFWEEGVLDMGRFLALLQKFELSAKWARFKETFLEPGL